MFQNAFLSAFICQLLATLAFALPVANDVSASTVNPNWGYGTGGGIGGLIVLILDIIVIIEVLKSNRPPASKLVWCLVIFFLPIIGLIIYFLFSNRSSHNSGSYEVLP